MSARLWWMLRLVGLTNCSVLDGGFKSWTSLKLPVTDSIPPMAENYNNKYSYNSKYLVATENIMQLTKNEISRCEKYSNARLKLISSSTIENLPPRKKDTKYTSNRRPSDP